MGTKPPRDMVVIEDSLLISMAASVKFTAEFPFLKALAVRTKASCSRCSQRSNQDTSSIYRAAKATIAGMASANKRKLKELLNTRQVRVTYINGSQKAVQLTF